MITTAYFHSTEDSSWIAILDDGREIKFLADGEPAEALAQQLGGRQISPLTEEIHEDGEYWFSVTYYIK